jgi:hypothetical protein
MTNRNHVERDTAKPARELAAAELTADELECVSGGLGLRKSAGNGASGVMFLTFTFKL